MPNLDRAQMRNAALIYSIGVQMGMSARDIQIGLITAMQESSLRNLDGGDRDSAGLFQQRPSQGWGTWNQVTDPNYSIRKFYNTLKGVGNRASMPMWAAAQEVQRSAYPTAYKKHIPLVRSIWPDIQSGGGDTPLAMDGTPFPVTGVGATLPGGAPPPPPPDPTVNAPEAPSVLQANMSPGLGANQPGALSTPTQDQTGAEVTNTFDFLTDASANAITSPIRGVSGDVMATVKGGFTKGLDGWRNGVVDLAKEFIGVPYVWGGTSPNGFDCSGLLQYIFNRVGKDLPRVSYQQANSGKRIKLNALQPGDLVAWDNSSRNNGADHIAIYIGNGRIIEAPRPGLTVRMRQLGKGEGAWGVQMN